MYKPLLQFKVYPNPRNRNIYYLVRVFKYLKELRGISENPKGTLAFVDAPFLGQKQVGTINFCIKRIGMEIISHESTHAAIRYIERVKKNFDLSFKSYYGSYSEMKDSCNKEEYLCLLVGRIASQINSKFHKEGIYK